MSLQDVEERLAGLEASLRRIRGIPLSRRRGPPVPKAKPPKPPSPKATKRHRTCDECHEPLELASFAGRSPTCKPCITDLQTPRPRLKSPSSGA